MRLLRRPLLLIPLVLLLLFAAAVVAGYTLLPGVVRSQGQAWTEKNLQHKLLTMGAISFDPWSLLLDIRDVAIANTAAPRAPLVTIKALQVDLGIASLWKMSAQLDALRLDTPVVDAILRKDGSINLLELMPRDDGSPTPEVFIAALDVKNGAVRFTDQRRATPQTKSLLPVTFSLTNFATRTDAGGNGHLEARSDEGESFSWTGKVAMAPLGSNGRFNIGALRLASIGRFAGDLIPATLAAGTVDLAGQYRFAALPAAPGRPVTTEFDVDVTKLALADVDVTASTGDHVTIKALGVAPTKLSLAADALTLGDVAIDGIAVSRPSGERAAVAGVRLASTRYAIKSGAADIGAAAIEGISVTGRGKGAETLALAGVTVAPSQVLTASREARIGLVSATGLRLGARVAADNSISIPGLYPMALPKSAPATGPAWKTSLAGFELGDAAMRIAIARPAPVRPQTVTLSPMTVKVGPLTSEMDAPLQIDMATTINGKAKLHVAGTAATSGNADLGIELANFPLAAAAALAPPNNVVVRGGALSVKGRLQVAAARAGPRSSPSPSFAGNIGIANLDLALRQDNSDLLSWKQLAISGIRYRSAPDRLAIARIDFDRPVSHVVFSRQERFNLQSAAGIAPEPAAPEAAPAQAASPVLVAATAETPPALVTPAPEAPAAAARPKLAIAAPVSSSLNAAGKLLPISIGEISVRGGIIAFEDLSIEPNFAVRIQGFTGAVTGLSTAPGSQARFNLKGYVVDRYSPVTITGRANVFAYDANTDLTAKFSNIELPVFNPYSGKWAGYAIAKGKLTTTLHYRIVNRGLQADHNIVVDQLTWGDATDSKQKVSLPLRMATSLMKDSNGVINLDLPVGGTLDDPTFKVWPIIWKIVGNVLTKIITAPFKFIGSLFGGDGDKAQFVTFEPGSAVLPAEAGKVLAAIAKGLADKTEINLDIPAGAGSAEDAEAITTAKLHAAAIAGKKGPVAADYAALDAGKKADQLRNVYKAKFGKGPSFPQDAGVEKAGMFAGGEAKKAAAESQVKWLEDQLRAKFAATDAELAALGQARAAAVKDALLGEGAIAPERVFVSTASSVKAKDGKIEMELQVK